MSHSSLDKVMRHIRNLAASQNAGNKSDAELLRAFSIHDDQAAFTILTKRHGPLVLAVCRRVLQQLQDAEDAFQATFIVLARYAATLSKIDSLGGWLHRVSYRIALDARKAAARRRRHEREAKTMGPTNPAWQAAWQAAWREVQLVLDDEIQRLPEKYREPFILCCLENQTCLVAARRLRLKEGTVWSRLAEARKRLQKRLSRRGVELTAVLGAAALASNPTMAGTLVAKAVTAATNKGLTAGAISEGVSALVNGMTRCLVLKKIKVGVGMFLAVSAMFGVTGMGVYRSPPVEKKALQDQNRAALQDTNKQGNDSEKKKEMPAAMDLYGDPLPPGAVVRLGTVRLRHNSYVFGVAFSPDGKSIASIASSDRIRLWDASTGILVRELQQSSPLDYECLALSPDGSKLVAGGTHGKVHLWNVATGKMIFEKDGHVEEVHGVAFAPDGLTFASAGGNIRVWNTTTGAEIQNLQPQGRRSGKTQGIAFSPDGKLLAASRGADIHVWKTDTWTSRLTIPKAYPRVEIAVAFQDDNTLLSSEYGRVDFWDVRTGRKLRELNIGGGHFCAIALSADRKFLYSTRLDKIVIWDINSGEKTQEVSGYYNAFGKNTNQLTISPDSKSVAVCGGDCTVQIWDITTGKRRLHFREGHGNRIDTADFSSDGRQILTGGADGTVRIWDAATAKQLRIRDLAKDNGKTLADGTVAAFSPDGAWIASGGGEWPPQQGIVGSCRLWDAASGKELKVQAFPRRVGALAFAPDSKKLAVGSIEYDFGQRAANDNRPSPAIYIWDLESRNEPITVAGQEGPCLALAYSPNGKTLAWIDRGSLRLWDVATRKQQVFRLPAVTDNVAFSPDGRMAIVSENFKEHLYLLEVVTGETVRAFKIENTCLNKGALSPDGRILATCQSQMTSSERDYDYGTIHLWDIETRSEVLRFSTGSSSVYKLAFSTDGKSLIAGMNDGTALTWSLKNIKPRIQKTIARHDLERYWDDLGGGDAAKAHEAIWTLAAAPAEAVPLLRNRLKPVARADQTNIQKWITDLDSEKFTVRQAAAKELEKVGHQVQDPIKKALQGNVTLETRRRLEQILNTLSDIPGVETVRIIRAIMALERIGSPNAQRVLESLAGGAPGARESEEAKASLERLKQRVK